jgi:hypothetical protein
METLRIDSLFEKQSFIKGNLIKWEILMLKNRKLIKGYTIASMIILIMGIIAYFDDGRPNPFICLGIFFLLIALLLFYSRIFSKRKFQRNILEIAEKFEAMKLDFTYEFSEESIKYWDKEKNMEFKWALFTYYTIYKGYLVIVLNNSLIDSYLFKRNESGIDEYEKILEFAKSKLEFKEIK